MSSFTHCHKQNEQMSLWAIALVFEEIYGWKMKLVDTELCVSRLYWPSIFLAMEQWLVKGVEIDLLLWQRSGVSVRVKCDSERLSDVLLHPSS